MAELAEVAELMRRSLRPLEVGGDVVAIGLKGAAELNGRKGRVVAEANEVLRYGVRFYDETSRPTVRVLQKNLISAGDPHPDGGGNMHPTAFDVVLRSPAVMALDCCDQLCAMLVQLAAPPSAQARLPSLIEFGSDITRGFNDRDVWHQRAEARFVWVQLDAVAHHLIIEWRQGHGWRIVQSFLRDAQAFVGMSGYTALQWCAPDGPPVGSFDDGACHAAFGRGRHMSDAELKPLWDAVLNLRKVADDFLVDVLLPQTPFDLAPRRFPEDGDQATKITWLQAAAKVAEWANDLDNRGKNEGLHSFTMAQHERVAIGGTNPLKGLQLFLIPTADKDALDQAYARVTGEAVNAFVYLRILSHIGYANGLCRADEGDLTKFGGYRGFSVIGTCWNN